MSKIILLKGYCDFFWYCFNWCKKAIF